MDYEGAKLALYLGPKLAVILRDTDPALPFPDHWDLPGGGREGEEAPLTCALRECREELGLDVPPEAVIWGRRFDENGQGKYFYVAHLAADAAEQVVFGNEGQRWALMDETAFLSHPRAVPAFQSRLRTYLAERDAAEMSRKCPPACVSGGR
ncbi:NUDIX hydrolase [Sulfitobacter aestuarii]|uniref:NUDIX hydrolase n=1 Tax=Sulfitobacter aestuarii TaxID=2161676 RepID=A0ABW5U1V0_9RHOB